MSPDRWDGWALSYAVTTIKTIFAAAALLGAAVILFSLAGRWIPAADSFGHFRHFLIAGTCAVSLVTLLLARRAAIVGLVASVIGLADMPELLPPNTERNNDTWRLVQFNLNYRNQDLAVVEALIERENPDIITLQEVSSTNTALLTRLSGKYPVQSTCAVNRVMSVAVLSKSAADGPAVCLPRTGFTAVPLSFGGQRATLVAVHLHWPWPYGQRPQVVQMAETLGAMKGPLIVAGDFNAAPWSAAVRHIARATDTRIVPGLRQTIHLTRFHVPLPIDHALLPRGWSVADVRVVEKAGSDHNAVVVDFAFPLN